MVVCVLQGAHFIQFAIEIRSPHVSACAIVWTTWLPCTCSARRDFGVCGIWCLQFQSSCWQCAQQAYIQSFREQWHYVTSRLAAYIPTIYHSNVLSSGWVERSASSSSLLHASCPNAFHMARNSRDHQSRDRSRCKRCNATLFCWVAYEFDAHRVDLRSVLSD